MFWPSIFAVIGVTAAWYRASLRTTAIAFATALAFYALFGGSFLVFLLLLLLWLGFFVPLSLPPLRQEWISRPLLEWLQDRGAQEMRTPPVAAESAGASVWMSGTPDWAYWLSLPQPALTPLEKEFLDGPAERFCRTWPQPESGLNLAAAAVPAVYGGAGLSVYAQQALLTKIASGAGMAAALDLARSFYCTHLIERLGSDAQKQDWLGRIARGARMQALALSAVHGYGGQMADSGVIQRGLWKGHEVPGLRIQFEKRASTDTSALHAVLVAVAVREHPAIQRGWVWVARDSAGVSADLLSGRDVFVPLSQLMVETAGELPQSADLVSAVPMAGVISICAERAAAALRLKPSQNEDETLLLARLGACAYTLEALRRCMPELDGAALRLVNARYCDDGLRLAQRLGLATEPVVDTGIEAAMRLARNLSGAQALRAGLGEKNPALALTQFDRALTDHARHVVQSGVRALLLGLSHGRLLPAPVLGALSVHYGRISRYSAATALLSAALPWLSPTPGRAVVQRELAIVWGRLCAAASILRCFENDGRPQADEAFALWALADISREIEQWLDSALHALPSRFFSVLLRIAMFPLGRWARPPRAAWAAPILERLQDPRARALCPFTFSDAGLLRLRAALLLQQECAELEPRLNDSRLRQPRRMDRIHEALGLGLLTNEHAAKLRELQNLSELGAAMLTPSQQNPAPQANLRDESEYEPSS